MVAKMTHMLIELFCSRCNSKKGECITPCNGSFEFSVNCLQCPYSSYTYCPDELSVSDSEGLVNLEEGSIGFGGDMFPDCDEAYWVERWREIAKRKIAEAYDEYMNEFKQRK